MRFTRFYLFLLLGGVLLLLGPTTALTQPGGGAPPDGAGGGGRRGGGGGAPGGGGPGGGGAPQDAGGGGGRRGGGMGGGNADPKARAAMMFNFVANGKDFVTIAELEASAAKMGDTTAHDKLQQFLQTQNIPNGQLNRDQFAIYLEQRMAERQQGGGGQGGGGPGGRTRGGQGAGVPNPAADERDAERWFRDQDKNGDGVLEAEEMTEQLRAELSKWDTNKNGVIELDEYKEYYKARIAFLREQNPSNSQGGTWDPTQIIQPPEAIEEKRPVVYHAGNLPKELPAWFAQMDRDKDGQVGLYEWKDSGRPIEEFRAMDINGDGFITVEEALRYQRVIAKKNHTEGSPGMPTDVAVAFGGPGGGRGQWGGQPGGGQPGGGQWGGMQVGGQPGGAQWGGMQGGQPGGGQWGGQQAGGQQGGGRQRGGQPGGGQPGGAQWGGPQGGGQPGAAQQPGGGQPGGGRNRNRDPNADPNAGNGGGGQPGGGRGRPGGQAP